MSYPKRYVPKRLSKKDKKKQKREIKKSRKAYKKGNYYTRKKVKSFKSKESAHVTKAKKIYGVDNVSPSSNLAKKTGCSISALRKIVKKGQGAYYSSGSRPNQTGHSWGRARLASSITGGKAAAVDFNILESGCKPGSKALRLAKASKKRHGHGTRRVPKHKGGAGSVAMVMVEQGKQSKRMMNKASVNKLREKLVTYPPQKYRKTYKPSMSTIQEGGKRKTRKNRSTKMHEKIIKFEKGPGEKKYTAHVKDKKTGKIIFDNNGDKIETSILDGNCKLQWKVDWAMRWFTFDVDFEMYGKDLTESAILSSKICRVLGKKPPNGFAYELFLDEKGEKISKSKGNGISIEQWLRYASPESLALYMYPNPKRAKKLYSDVVPKTVDEYLELIEKYPNQTQDEKIMNPVWHVHNGNPPKEKIVMPFSMLLNLVGSSNSKNKEVLWKFINRFHKNINPQNFPVLDGLTEYAINYFKDKVEPNKKFKKPNLEEKKALLDLSLKLKSLDQSLKPEEIQTIVYSVGKNNGYEKKLREWFKLIYQVLFGEEDGPRMGYFISFFGIKETIELLNGKIK